MGKSQLEKYYAKGGLFMGIKISLQKNGWQPALLLGGA